MNEFEFMKEMLDSAVREGCFPAATAAVGCRGEVLYACAAGEATLSTRFDMASMTKVLSTTILALLALEDGTLTLSDTLSRFFPAPPDKAEITIFQLMTHTAGFTPSFWLSDETDDPDDAASCILKHPLEAPPNGTPRYSCMGFILLGKLLEIAYGERLDLLAQRRIFKPLGMPDTGYGPIEPDSAAPTETDPATGIAWRGIVHDENARFLRGVSGNAGVFSTVMDCARFAGMLAMNGDGFLSPATLRTATVNYTPGHDVHRGLGFHLGGTPLCFIGDLFPPDSFGHTGFTGTSLVICPHTGIFAILLANRVHPTRENERIFRFRRQFHNRIYATASKGRMGR